MVEKVPCKHPFSNGIEYEMFLEQCYSCSRYRAGRCRIIYACEKARFDIRYFPYDDLMEWSKGYGGKICRHYTQEPIKRTRTVKQCKGQESLF